MAWSICETGNPSLAYSIAASRARPSDQRPYRANSSPHPATTLGVRQPSKGERDCSSARQSTSPEPSLAKRLGSRPRGTAPRNCSTSVVFDAASWTAAQPTPPTLLVKGWTTVATAAALTAASTAFPPCRMAVIAACVAHKCGVDAAP